MGKKSKSDTPETDSEHELSKYAGDTYRGFVTYAFARKMERERDEARMEAYRWRDAWANDTPLGKMGGTVMPWVLQK